MGITQYFGIDLPEVKNDRNEKEAKVPPKKRRVLCCDMQNS